MSGYKVLDGSWLLICLHSSNDPITINDITSIGISNLELTEEQFDKLEAEYLYNEYA